jgi:hypothetical protein
MKKNDFLIRFIITLTLAFIIVGCQHSNFLVNNCIDTQLNKYDTLQKNLENSKEFKKSIL